MREKVDNHHLSENIYIGEIEMGKLIIKMLYENVLPRRNGLTGEIDWMNSKGYRVPFIYGDIEGEVYIIDVVREGRRTNLIIRYKDKIKCIDYDTFKKGYIGDMLEKKRNYIINKNGNYCVVENLPKYWNGTHKGDIEWLKTIGMKIRVMYFGKQYEFIVKSFNIKTSMLTVEYNQQIDKIKSGNLLNGKIGRIVGQYTKEFKFKVGNRINNFTVIDRKYRRVNNKNQKWYELRCDDCGYDKYWITESQLLSNPITKCPRCGDGISVPNKIAWAIMLQLKESRQIVYFEREYIRKWTMNKAFDFYFVTSENIAYILEMDGGFHNKGNPYNKKTAKELQNIDSLKEKLAYENNIQKVIRVNCDYDSNNSIYRYKYIKEQINQSELVKKFDLTMLNWKSIFKFASEGVIKKVCKFRSENKEISTKEISAKFNISESSVRNYLNIGNELGLCKYNSKEEQIKGAVKCAQKSKERFSKSVSVYNGKGEYIKSYYSMNELERKSKEELGVKMIQTCISRHVIPNGRDFGKLYKGFLIKLTDMYL